MNTRNIMSVNINPINHGTRLKVAYDKHAANINAIPAEKLISVTFDVMLAYTTSQGKLIKLGALREEVRKLEHIDKRLIDELDERLLALGHALALHYAQHMSPDQLEELAARVAAARQTLAADGAALARRKLLPAERVVELKGPLSRHETGFSVLSMTADFRAHWAEIQGKTAVTIEELDAIDADADRLLVAISARSNEEAERATQARDAALTYFAEAWEELRRGVSHLRWYFGDLDELVPTVFTNRNQRPGGKKPAKPGAEQPEVVPAPAPTVAAVASNVVGDDDESPFTV